MIVLPLSPPQAETPTAGSSAIPMGRTLVTGISRESR